MLELNNKFVGKYFGPDMISSIEITPQTTPSGGVVFSVVFASGARTIVTEKTLVISISDKPGDYTKLLDTKLQAVVPEIVALLEEYDIASFEVESLVSRIKANVEMRFNRAINFLFSGDDSRFIPGWDHKTDVTMLMSEKVISQIPKDAA